MRFHPSHSSHIPFSYFFCFKTQKGVKTKSISSHFSPHLPLLFSSLMVSPIFLPLNTTFPFILSHFLNPKHHFLYIFSHFLNPKHPFLSIFSNPKHPYLSIFSHFFPFSLTFSLIPTSMCPPFLISTFLTYRSTHDNRHGCSSSS